MNLLYFLQNQFLLLDMAVTPRVYTLGGEASPATKLIVIVVLVLFLAFIGYLIYNSLKRK